MPGRVGSAELERVPGIPAGMKEGEGVFMPLVTSAIGGRSGFGCARKEGVRALSGGATWPGGAPRAQSAARDAGRDTERGGASSAFIPD